MRTNDRATFRDPLSGRVTEVTLLETARWQNEKFFTVVDDGGKHWTASPKHLREIENA